MFNSNYRNIILKKYREDPCRYLSVTECQRILKRCFFETIRIYLFLEQWKLINDWSIKNSISFSEQLYKTEYHRIFYKKTIPLITLSPGIKKAVVRRDTEQNIFQCSFCGKNETKDFYYRCIKKTERDVCADCFLLWKLPDDVSGYDFFRVPFEKPTYNKWTKEEEERLFRSLLEYDQLFQEKKTQEKKWSFVSKNVGTKNNQECILYFLRQPLFDQKKILDFEERIPFSNTKNPVLCILSFLCSVVHPQIASFVAKKIMNEIVKEKKINSSFSKLEDKVNSIIKKALDDSKAFTEKKVSEYNQEIEVRISALLENQTRKIEAIILKFEELDRSLDYEKKELEKRRLQLFLERINMKKEFIRITAEMKSETFLPEKPENI